ncbi:MAG: crossover junction endodeoxyribonuclease RuvC [Candidatus Andersenbacteria bacterium RIFCSPHIGHO2_12_FULL_45_11b]|uniref:Crossover junction endodeoxyribonuclease RuvC n=1 Tax=Candidatus Andersenbacteria bacterium RIFCSPHIGHO2_12_FULL_45_11b TaxID=1797282 RepID=A0A1G1X9Q9_9BACT|nr:MAG: crossover junction endodeoxyribonuclease RuvC [Candidatus Andersenbacteria bacterium RIFCSPHIGHO2_12_FULL_45_11b]
MIILGLDPGIARTGYGIINTKEIHQFVQCGCITTLPIHALEHRLNDIADDLTSIITTHRPDIAIVEEIFFGKNAKTAISTAHVRGVLLQILTAHHIPIQGLTPLQIKSRLTGYGAATKAQIQHVITRQLHLSHIPQPDDAADALAAALCATTTTI